MGGKAHRRITDVQGDILGVLTRVTIEAVSRNVEDHPDKDDHQDPDNSAIVHAILTLQSVL